MRDAPATPPARRAPASSPGRERVPPAVGPVELERMWRFLLVCWCVLVVGYAATKGASADLTFLTREGCVNTDTMRARFDEALTALGRSRDYQVLDADTLAANDRRRGYGSADDPLQKCRSVRDAGTTGQARRAHLTAVSGRSSAYGGDSREDCGGHTALAH
jgi:hypothetical protein